MGNERILIGVPTYNTTGRIEAVWQSINEQTAPEWLEKCVLVGLDDGSPDPASREEAAIACIDNGSDFIQHDENMGIPKSWNDLSRHAEADIVVLLNDDIEIVHPRWLEAMVYFLDNNKIAGSVGWPTVHKDPETREVYYTDGTGPPGACGAPVGCCFAFRQEDYRTVDGFWDELISFYEETDFGFKMYRDLNKRNYMLPWPSVLHWHSRTFSLNHELATVEIDGERVSRMDRSRRMFADKWGCQDRDDAPQNELHEKYVVPIEPIELTWLTEDDTKTEMVK